MVATILIADEPGVLAVIERALEGYNLIRAYNISQAQRRLVDMPIDLFVFGVHFDDSRALDLVKYVRRLPGHENTPVIMFRCHFSEHAKVLRHTMETMQSLKIVDHYIENEGPEFSLQLRAAVARFLPSEKVVSQRA